MLIGKAPVQGTNWWIAETGGEQDWPAQCYSLALKTAELQAEVNRVMMMSTGRTPENIALRLSLLRQAQTYDQEWASWIGSAPEQWRYKTVAWVDEVPNDDYARSEVFPGRIDVYPGFWVANLWSIMRSSRIVLAIIIMRCAAWACAPADYHTTPEYTTASRTIVEMNTDIIAFVPYALGWHLRQGQAGRGSTESSSDSEQGGVPSPTSFVCGDDRSPKALAAVIVTASLTLLNAEDCLTDAQRAWVVGRLRFLGEELGMHCALLTIQQHLSLPSMFICLDNFMASTQPDAYDFMKMVMRLQGGMPIPAFATAALASTGGGGSVAAARAK